jgi:predicted nuclease of predicted toxin-antitoxin system
MALKIYTNESVPIAIVTGLQRRGVNATCARDSGNLGLTDPQQLEYAVDNHMVIFTHDADFLTLANEYKSRDRLHWGIIYVHQDKLSLGECIRRLKELAELFELNDFQNHIAFL